MATYEQYVSQWKTHQQILDATAKAYGQDSAQYKSVMAKQPSGSLPTPQNVQQPPTPQVQVQTQTPDPVKPPAPVQPTAPAPTPVQPPKPTVQKQETVAPVAPNTPESKPLASDSVKTLTGGQNLTELQKRSALEVYKTQWAQAAQRWVDEMSQYNKPNMTSDDYFNAIKTGAGVSQFGTNTREYAEAKSRANEFTRFKGMSPEQLSVQLKSGKLVPWTTAFNDLLNDPQTSIVVKKAQALNQVNKSEVDTLNAWVSESNRIMSSNKNVQDALSDWVLTQDELMAMIETPQIREAKLSLSEKAKALKAKKREIDAVDAATDKQLEWKSVSWAYRSALRSQNRKQLTEDYNALLDDYNVEFASLSESQNMAMKALDYTMQNYREDRAFSRQKELAAYQSELALKSDQAKFDQELKQLDAKSTNPMLATQSLIDQYRKIWVLAERSDQQIVEDIKSQVAQGRTLGEALSDLNKAFQGKKSYKDYVASKAPDASTKRYMTVGENSMIYDTEKWIWIKNPNAGSGSGSSLYEEFLAESEATSKVGWLLWAENGSIVPSTLPRTTNKNGGAECLEYVERVTGQNLGSDSYDSKLANATEKDASKAWVGNTAVWMPDPNNPTFKKYGHIGIITADKWDSWEIKSSNLNGDGRISTDIVPKSKIEGYNTSVNAFSQGWQVETKDNTKVRLATYLAQTPEFKNMSEKEWAIWESNLRAAKKSKDDTQLKSFAAKEFKKDKNVNEAINDWNTTNEAISNLVRLAEVAKTSRPEQLKEYVKWSVLWELGDLTLLKQWVGMFAADYIKKISGTAASDTERANLLSLLPSVWNSTDRNLALLKQFWDVVRMQTYPIVQWRAGEFTDYVFGDTFKPKYKTSGSANKPITTAWNNASTAPTVDNDLLNEFLTTL